MDYKIFRVELSARAQVIYKSSLPARARMIYKVSLPVISTGRLDGEHVGGIHLVHMDKYSGLSVQDMGFLSNDVN